MPELKSKSDGRHCKQKIMKSIRQDIPDPNRRQIALNRIENLMKIVSPNLNNSFDIKQKRDLPNKQQNLVVELMARHGAEFRFVFL